jgi:hypothetical protein
VFCESRSGCGELSVRLCLTLMKNACRSVLLLCVVVCCVDRLTLSASMAYPAALFWMMQAGDAYDNTASKAEGLKDRAADAATDAQDKVWQGNSLHDHGWHQGFWFALVNCCSCVEVLRRLSKYSLSHFHCRSARDGYMWLNPKQMDQCSVGAVSGLTSTFAFRHSLFGGANVVRGPCRPPLWQRMPRTGLQVRWELPRIR